MLLVAENLSVTGFSCALRNRAAVVIMYGLALAIIVALASHLRTVNGAEAFYVFGDSFVDTGNGGYTVLPYGITWPGHPAGRACDGRNQVDYFAELLDLPSPTPFQQLNTTEFPKTGINFGQGGAGTTYAFGYRPLDTQVDQLENFVVVGKLSKTQLRRSVALVSLGVNDYGAYNVAGKPEELGTIVTTVVDKITLNIIRLHGLGIRNIIVSNLAVMACSPYITVASNYSACSRNTTLFNETVQHNTLLEKRVQLLKHNLHGSHLVIVNQTKAFEFMFEHGHKYGFADVLVPCCTGKNDLYELNCGATDSNGHELYKLCKDLSKAVIFDGIHPTQATWKFIIKHLYAATPGFTNEGPELSRWIKKYAA